MDCRGQPSCTYARGEGYNNCPIINKYTLYIYTFQGKSLQFDQWRIAHLAEFGINNFDAAPQTPAPSRPGQERSKDRCQRPPRTPKSKRKEKSEREASERKAKTRRDSEPAQQPEEQPENDQDKENAKPSQFGSLFSSLSCGQCGAGFANLMEYLGHKKVCIPDEDFGHEESAKTESSGDKEQESSKEEDIDMSSKREENIKSGLDSDSTKIGSETEKDCKGHLKSDSNSENSDITIPCVDPGSTDKTKGSKTSNGLTCNKCKTLFTSMVKYDAHRTKGCVGNDQK